MWKVHPLSECCLITAAWLTVKAVQGSILYYSYIAIGLSTLIGLLTLSYRLVDTLATEAEIIFSVV